MRYIINPNAMVESVQEEAVLVFPGGSIITLNETASFILNKIVRGKTLEETARALSEKYGLDSSEAEADVEQAVQEMVDCNAVLAVSE